MNQGLHLVVFCAVDYQHMLADHLATVNKFVQDKILSTTVVSNAEIDTNCNLVLDKDFWRLIDPDFVYQNVYRHNWVRQQILKLNLDKILSGTILLNDVEVRYHKPMTWCCNDQYTQVIVNRKPHDTADRFVDAILGIRPNVSYMTESMIVATDILQDLRKFIEQKFKTHQVDAYRKIIYDDPLLAKPLSKIFMSEYELYNNFVNMYHSDRIWKKLNYELGCYTSCHHPEIYTKDTRSHTNWINFYESVKDPSWPNCYHKEDFYKLPRYIQEECVRLHGYRPEINHGH
jgi:hypothetical protein